MGGSIVDDVVYVAMRPSILFSEYQRRLKAISETYQATYSAGDNRLEKGGDAAVRDCDESRE